MRYTIAVDFDGVLHSYTSPWVAPHIIPGPPVAGAIWWLWLTLQHFDVVIHSTRCQTWRGRRAVRAWLRKHAKAKGLWREETKRGLEDVKLSYSKPPALVYLDDRALRFEGKFPSVDEIHRLRPWNKP